MRVEQRLMSVSSDDTASSECITDEMLTFVKSRWSCMCGQKRLWLQKLHCSQPGQLGQIGDWLCDAEQRLRSMTLDEDDSPASAMNEIQQQLADILV